MKRNISQNARLHKLLSQLSIDADTKADLVMQFTGGRTASSAKMDVMECQYLINHLASLTKQAFTPSSNESDKLRKKIISIFREMGYNTPKGKADMTRIQAAVRNWGKEFNLYAPEELSKIISILEKTWLPHFYKKQLEKVHSDHH